MSAAAFLHELAGHPPSGRAVVDAPDGAVCLVCGGGTAGRAVRGRDALGVNFDFTQARRADSQLVCLACAWALAGKPPATLRMWSIAATTGRELPGNHPKCVLDLGPQVHLTNRADMRALARMLTDPPDGDWVVTVAVSGQKHVVPYAEVNHGRGPWRVRVETADVTSSPRELAGLLGRVARLRRAGFGPDTIAAVDPGTWLSTQERLAAWQRHAVPLIPYRGSPLLQLAATIPTKEHLDDYLVTYPTGD